MPPSEYSHWQHKHWMMSSVFKERMMGAKVLVAEMRDMVVWHQLVVIVIVLLVMMRLMLVVRLFVVNRNMDWYMDGDRDGNGYRDMVWLPSGYDDVS